MTTLPHGISQGRPVWRVAIAAVVIGVSVLPPSIGLAADPPGETAASVWYDRDDAYTQGTVDRPTVPSERLNEFLGERTGGFILPWKTIAWQVGEGLGVAYLHVRHLPEGRRLLWGCRRHSCTEKAAVVLSPDGKVEAAALIHARCRFATPADVRRPPRLRRIDCDTPNHTLTVFAHVTQTYRPDFERWAEAVTGEKLPVEIYWV